MAKADVVVVMDSDDAKLFRSYQRQIEAEKRKEQQTRKTAAAQDRAARAQQRANQRGTQATAAQAQVVRRLGIAWGAAGVAIATVTRALQQNAQVAQNAAQRNRAQIATAGQISLQAGSRQEFKQLISLATQTFREGGAPTQEAAQAQVLALRNAGLLGERRLFSQLGARGVDVSTLATQTSAVRSAFGAEAGTARQVVERAIAAGSFTPASETQVLQGAARAGAEARQLGISSREVLAAVSAISPTTGDAQQAGSRIRALLTSIVRRGDFGEGQTLSGYLNQLQGRTSQQQLAFFGGNAEALTAASLIRSTNVPGTQRRVFEASLAAQRGGGLSLEQRFGLLERDEQFGVTLRGTRSRAERELTETREGTARELLDQQLDDIARNGSRLERAVSAGSSWLMNLVVGPEATLRATRGSTVGDPLVNQGTQQAIDQFLDGANKIDRAADKLNNASGSRESALRRETAAQE